jgi:hypothetical protein
MSKVKSMMIIIGTMVMFLVGCGSMKAMVSPSELLIIKNSSLIYSEKKPIKIYIHPEKEFVDYLEKVDFYEIYSIKESLKDSLEKEIISVYKKDPLGYEIPHTLKNPFVITENKDEAEVSIFITIDEFKYGNKGNLKGSIIRLGYVDIIELSSEKEQALLIAEIEIKEEKTGEFLVQLETTSVSDGDLVRRKAFSEVIKDAVEKILTKLYQL